MKFNIYVNIIKIAIRFIVYLKQERQLNQKIVIMYFILQVLGLNDKILFMDSAIKTTNSISISIYNIRIPDSFYLKVELKFEVDLRILIIIDSDSNN